ncbi:uncharacterized protein LOC134178833 isoform X4 [Corticium candelabrum]|uniref:uncharacterized protein LOC134178833 isoform X4 n=1 Tax=Corticium candelabrum TaxID=121492 RepID=UPI002E269BA8|nr:uncharacterized protein LOC134178833 isoform X4 [Corticium candelabrum]
MVQDTTFPLGVAGVIGFLLLILMVLLCKYKRRLKRQNRVQQWINQDNTQAPADPVVNSYSPGFLRQPSTGYPYYPDVLHEWMEIPNIYDSSHGVKVYNGASLTGDSVCQDLRNSLRNNRHEFYYHATSWMSARAIYEKGVNLKRGGKSQDFSDSDGYYLHKMLKPAVRWAKRKGGEQPAILVYAYTIPPKFQVLNLCGLRNEKLWENVVKAFRSGNKEWAPNTNPPPGNADCVIGPICANGNDCPKRRVNYSLNLCKESDGKLD